MCGWDGCRIFDVWEEQTTLALLLLLHSWDNLKPHGNVAKLSEMHSRIFVEMVWNALASSSVLRFGFLVESGTRSVVVAGNVSQKSAEGT